MYYSCVKFSQYQFVRLGVALSRNKKRTDRVIPIYPSKHCFRGYKERKSSFETFFLNIHVVQVFFK